MAGKPPAAHKGVSGVVDDIAEKLFTLYNQGVQATARSLPASTEPYLPYVRRAGNVVFPAAILAGVAKAYYDSQKSDPYANLPDDVRARVEAFDKRVAYLVDAGMQKEAAVTVESVANNVSPGVRRMIAGVPAGIISYALMKDYLRHRQRMKLQQLSADPSSALSVSYDIQ